MLAFLTRHRGLVLDFRLYVETLLMSKHSQRTTPRAPSESFTLTCGCSALAALPRANATWDDGVDGALLCYVLFSVHDDPAHGAAMLRFCCSPVHGQHGSRYHELNTPHDCSLRVRDVADST